MKIVLIVLGSLLVLGYLFVQWANRPENVNALQKKREADKKEAIEREVAEKQKAEKNAQKEKELAGKTDADLKWIVEENFSDNSFSKLKVVKTNNAQIKENALQFNVPIITPKQQGNFVLGLTEETIEDFVAEVNFEAEGCTVGIVFGYEGSPEASQSYDCAYTGLNGGELVVKGSIARGLLDYKHPQQTARFEKKGKHFKVSVDGKKIIEKDYEKYMHEAGKVGLFVHFTNATSFNKSAKAVIKSFKVGTY